MYGTFYISIACKIALYDKKKSRLGRLQRPGEQSPLSSIVKDFLRFLVQGLKCRSGGSRDFLQRGSIGNMPIAGQKWSFLKLAGFPC